MFGSFRDFWRKLVGPNQAARAQRPPDPETWDAIEQIAKRLTAPFVAKGFEPEVTREPLPDGGMELRIWPPNPDAISVGFYVGHDGMTAIVFGENVVEDFYQSRKQDLADWAGELESWANAAITGNYAERLKVKSAEDGGDVTVALGGWLTVDGESHSLRGYAPPDERRARGRTRSVTHEYKAWTIPDASNDPDQPRA